MKEKITRQTFVKAALKGQKALKEKLGDEAYVERLRTIGKKGINARIKKVGRKNLFKKAE